MEKQTKTHDEKMAEFRERAKRLNDEYLANRARMTPEELQAEKDAAEKERRARCLCDPDCPICGGEGYTHWQDKDGCSFSKECPNYGVILIKKNASKYGMTINEIDTLDWNVIKNLNNSWTARDKVREVLDRGYGWVFLWGDHGLAKSLILRIAVAASLRARQEAAYTNMVGILDNLKRAFSSGYGECPTEESRIEFWQNIPVLAIDEFNRAKDSEWAGERRFALMDTRYVQAIRQETITLIASNTSPEEQDSYLRDRILDGRFDVIELKGPSVRKSIHNKDFMF